MFYKKKNVKATKALINILKPFFSEIIGLHKRRNLELKRLEINKESILEINNAYEYEVTTIAESIFKELEVLRPDVNSIGLFIDPYFVRKIDGNLFLEDTRPADALPRQNISIPQEQNLLENNADPELMGSKTDSDDSSASIFPSESNTTDISLSLDVISIKSIDEEYKRQSAPTTNELAMDVIDGAQEDINTEMSNIFVDLAIGRQEEEIINSVPSIDNQVVFAENKPEDWNPENKKKIMNLVLVYQEHLTKKYCFRLDDCITESKKSITKELLNKLSTNGTDESFFEYVYGVSTTNILNKHRDLSIIQKIGQFFKRHNKTEGTLLLDNIFSMLNENNITINTRSI